MRNDQTIKIEYDETATEIAADNLTGPAVGRYSVTHLIAICSFCTDARRMFANNKMYYFCTGGMGGMTYGSRWQHARGVQAYHR